MRKTPKYSCFQPLFSNNLKSKGYRSSPIRNHIIDYLAKNYDKLVSAKDIMDHLNIDTSKKMTIYNNVNFLMENKLVKSYHISKRTYYTVNSNILIVKQCVNCEKFVYAFGKEKISDDIISKMTLEQYENCNKIIK